MVFNRILGGIEKDTTRERPTYRESLTLDVALDPR